MADQISIGDTVRLKLDVFFGRKGTLYTVRDYFARSGKWLLEDDEGDLIEVERNLDVLEKVGGRSEG